MKFLVIGGCGFLGTNMATEILKKKYNLIIFDNLYKYGSEKNLNWLKKNSGFKYIHGDIRNRENIENIIKEQKPEVIFHLAAQVTMTESIKNPKLDFEINALGTINVLDSVRKYSPESILIYSSTNKVYGDIRWVNYTETEKRFIAPDFPNGFPETIPLNFQTPYGNSKGCADQYMLDYCRIFGIKTVVFRHSSMYGVRQFATFDQGWIGWFCLKAIEQKKGILKDSFTISGNGKQVRDVLYVDDLVNLYMDTVENIEKVKGQAFNIGGGMKNSLSILELFDILEKELNTKLNYKKLPPRQNDQKVFVANIGKINKLIGWNPQMDKLTGIKKMIKWIEEECLTKSLN